MCRLIKLYIFIPILFLFLTGCVSLKQPATMVHYYTLEYDPPVINQKEPLSSSIKIERFSVAPVYDTAQIIYRDEPFSRNAYAYHRWRVNPGDMITNLINRDLQNSGLFSSAFSHDTKFKSLYILEGEVEEIYELDEGEYWKGVLKLRVTLTGSNEPDMKKRIIFQKIYNTAEECKKKTPLALVEALSYAMAKLSREIINDIQNNLTGK